jgi:hypothetical protein
VNHIHRSWRPLASLTRRARFLLARHLAVAARRLDRALSGAGDLRRHCQHSTSTPDARVVSLVGRGVGASAVIPARKTGTCSGLRAICEAPQTSNIAIAERPRGAPS